MSGRAREDVSDRLSGCTGISNTRRHMIQGSEVILTDEYRAESRLPHKRKGVVFYSPSLESLFQGSILPTRDCKPVSRQKSYVHKYYACFFLLLLACQNIFRHFFSFRFICGCNRSGRKKAYCRLRPCDFDRIWKITVCSP